jgi:hypothetical protein
MMMFRIDDANRKHSKKFPYFVVRIIPTVYQTIPKSAEISMDDLVSEAKAISKKRNLRVCVVLGPKRAIYIEPDGRMSEKKSIPSGGIPVHIDKVGEPE